MRRALHLTRMGGRPRQFGGGPFRRARIIGNDLKISVSAFFIDLTFCLAAKTFFKFGYCYWFHVSTSTNVVTIY
jgi:hypothetical protein